MNLAGLPALVLPCGFVEGGGPAGLPVGVQMIGAAFDEVFRSTSRIQVLYTPLVQSFVGTTHNNKLAKWIYLS